MDAFICDSKYSNIVSIEGFEGFGILRIGSGRNSKVYWGPRA